MKTLDKDVFIEWLKAAFDYEKLKEEYEVEEDLVLMQDGQDLCFGDGTELGFCTGPFFNEIGVWVGRGMCSDSKESKKFDKELLDKYSDTARYYIRPATEWVPFQVYLRFIEENLDDIQENAEEEMEQEARISLRDYLEGEA